MRRVVELAAAALPWAVRDRYREEWLHDLAHADVVGVRRGEIAWGALRTAITADRMQAPSPAHAILQARLRIDAAVLHATIAMMLIFLAFGAAPVGIATLLLAGAAFVHSAVLVVQLSLASTTIGGAVRFAAPLWLLGLIALAAAAALALRDGGGWFGWAMAGAACMAASALTIEAAKPPKPAVVESVRPAARRRMLATGAVLGAIAVAVSLLDALVLLPLRRSPGATLDEAWRAFTASGGPASPLVAAALVAAIMVVPLALGAVGAARWARTERGILSWATGGVLVSVLSMPAYAAIIAFADPAGVHPMPTVGALQPLLAGVLVHFAYRGGADLAPLPPASVPLPPGPWNAPRGAADRIGRSSA
ncbi:hypothetical protein [Agrococcus sp. ProA11]|uniref:hypothetical protein n=1 Tax=Agrococcus chionoecetis TaxID=3153752 RepID=UPI0032604188